MDSPPIIAFSLPLALILGAAVCGSSATDPGGPRDAPDGRFGMTRLAGDRPQEATVVLVQNFFEELMPE